MAFDPHPPGPAFSENYIAIFFGKCPKKALYQSSYLTEISQIISVGKNLSCGEISDFSKEFEQFMEFYRNLCRFCSKFVRRKNYKYEVCPLFRSKICNINF